MIRLIRSGLVIAAMGIAVLVVTSPVESDVVPARSKGKTIKRFTGILSGPGAAGSVPKADFVHFLCDPRTLNWKIRVVHNGKGKTQFIGDVRICDHVEIMMEYYNPPVYFPSPINDEMDGTAIWIKKIP